MSRSTANPRRPLGGRVRLLASMSPAERRVAIRQYLDFLKSIAVFGAFGPLVNRVQRFLYLSYVPDSVREHGALPGMRGRVKGWTHRNERHNAGDMPRLFALALNARRVIDENVPGDFAELGVYKGNSARVLADAIAERGAGRRLYLFDTFGGFDTRDLAGVDAERAALFGDVSLEAVRDFVGHPDVCVYRPGYFPESLDPADDAVRFALVHLDADLYEPMKAGLEFFYPRLSPGALMLLHDYSSGHWPGTTRAVDEFLADKPESVILMPDKSGTAALRKV